MADARDDVHRRLGANVRDLRVRRRLTQEQLGERAGLSYKFIGEVERGVTNPSIESVAAIAKALDADIADLFGDGLVGWFAILDLDQVPPPGEPDQSWDDFAPELGADGTLLVRRLELLNIPQLSASPERMRGVVRLAVENRRVALQEGRSLSGREALLGALDVLVRPMLTGTSGRGQPSWAEVDAAMSA